MFVCGLAGPVLIGNCWRFVCVHKHTLLYICILLVFYEFQRVWFNALMNALKHYAPNVYTALTPSQNLYGLAKIFPLNGRKKWQRIFWCIFLCFCLQTNSPLCVLMPLGEPLFLFEWKPT